MLLGVTLLKKKYPMAKYLCVLLIVAGVALFMYKPKKVVGMEEHTIGYGELLLVRAPGGEAAFSSNLHQGTTRRGRKRLVTRLEGGCVFPCPHFWSLSLATWSLALLRP